MAFWSKWLKGPDELSGLDNALAQRDAIYQIGRENTQWVMDALVKQRDEARAALAAREAEVDGLRKAIESVVSLLPEVNIAFWDDDTPVKFSMKHIRRLAAALADHTP